MSNKFVNWWRSQQFQSALKRGDTRLAVQLLQEIQKSGARFSWLEKLFRDKLQFERSSQNYKKEAENLSSNLNEALQRLENPELQVDRENVDNFILALNQELIDYIIKIFNLIEHDENKLQCTGIDERIFDDFEARLVEYLQEEFSKIPDDKLIVKLQDAFEDINSLKSGHDPDYSFSLTPHVYFMKYFLEHVYCTYLVWFLIYQAG